MEYNKPWEGNGCSFRTVFLDDKVYRMYYTSWHVVETASSFRDAPSELSLYATESYFTGASSQLRRYPLRIDGFASVYAPLNGGEVLTKPINFRAKDWC